MALRVYLDTGEDFLTSLEFPVSHTWQTHFGILLQKNASTATVSTQSIPMPRLFSLTHPLDEMCPILLRPQTGPLAYLTDSDYVVVFVTTTSPLVLMYDQKAGKHFVSRLRPVTDEETNLISANDTTINPDATAQSETTQNYLNTVYGGSSSKHPSFSSINRTHASFSQKVGGGVGNQSQNVSTATSVGGMGSFASRSGFVQPSTMDRLHSTRGGGVYDTTSGRWSQSMADVRKEGRAMPAKPIAPEWCLEHVWTEPTQQK